MEFGAVHAGAIGLGAGLAASREHGQVVRRSYEAMVQAQQATIAQTKAIEHYMSVGCQLESKKQWSDAEKSFTYVLKVVALRDGPGSIKSVPALQHLVNVSKEQGKLTEAIDFQKTVVAFTKSAKVPNQQAVFNSQIDLSKLFIQHDDYTNAEPILRETVATSTVYAAMPPEKRQHALTLYAKVLRKLHKDSEADAIEATANQNSAADSKAGTATSNTGTSTANTSTAASGTATLSTATSRTATSGTSTGTATGTATTGTGTGTATATTGTATEPEPAATTTPAPTAESPSANPPTSAITAGGAANTPLKSATSSNATTITAQPPVPAHIPANAAAPSQSEHK
jgi:hypothetical protein